MKPVVTAPCATDASEGGGDNNTGSVLADALECAICLHQLSAANRVLPCQHTFCTSCLEEVAAAAALAAGRSKGADGEAMLHCPECRLPVTVPLDSLPQNIVVIRLLEAVQQQRRQIQQQHMLHIHGGPGDSPVQKNLANVDPQECSGHSLTDSHIERSSADGQLERPFADERLERSSVDGQLERPSADVRLERSFSDSCSETRSERLFAAFDNSEKPTTESHLTEPDTLGVSDPQRLEQALSEFDPFARGATAPVSSPHSVPTAVQQPRAAIPSARALRSYIGKLPRELSFQEDDVILLRRWLDCDWLEGQLNGRVGALPANHVLILVEPSANQRPTTESSANQSAAPQTPSNHSGSIDSACKFSEPITCRAISDFTWNPTGNDTNTYLQFKKGDTLNALARVSEHWLMGEIGSSRGIFPRSVVQASATSARCPTTPLASSTCPVSSSSSIIMATTTSPADLSTSSQQQRSSLAPPVPSRGCTPATPPPLPARPSFMQQPPTHALKPRENCVITSLRRSDSLSPQTQARRTSAPCVTRSLTSVSGSSTSSSSHARLSLSARGEALDSSSATGCTQISPRPLVIQRYRCIAAYPAGGEAELTLSIGDIVYVHRQASDGWFKGTLQQSGRTGLFPAMFVEPY